MRPPQLTTRQSMIAVAVIAVLLGIKVAVTRAFEREFPSTPVGWAWRQATIDVSNKSRYRALALAFEQTGEQWGEGTYLGPFTDKLAANQSVVIQDGAQVEPSDLEGTRLGKGVSWPIAPGTIGAVVADWATEEDSCYDSRRILVRFVAGPHRGEIGLVQRIYLRRRLSIPPPAANRNGAKDRILKSLGGWATRRVAAADADRRRPS